MKKRATANSLIPSPTYSAASIAIGLLATTLAASCGLESGREVEAISDWVDIPGGDPTCNARTIDGRVFYDDHRKTGRFSLRKSPTGTTGASGEIDGAVTLNFLGLLDAEVFLYEVDVDNLFLHHLGTAVVKEDGSFRWVGNVCDIWNDGSVDIAARVSLSNCVDPTERCFAVKDPDSHSQRDHYDDEWATSTYSHWHVGASQSDPRELEGTYANLGDYYYGIGATQRAPLLIATLDLQSKAASVFASMVDVTRAVHTEGLVPYDWGEVGEVEAIFPNPIGGNGHSHQKTERLCVPSVSSLVGGTNYLWPTGIATIHEYGHLVHYRAWDGVGKWTDKCYLDDCAIDDDGFEHKIQAFKEGWADFIQRVTLEGEPGETDCTAIESVAMTTCGGPALCTDQQFIANDITGILCDLWDPRPIPAHGLTEPYGSRDLELLAQATEHMWTLAYPEEREEVEEADEDDRASAPLGFCRFVEALADLDPLEEADILETVRFNLLQCTFDR